MPPKENPESSADNGKEQQSKNLDKGQESTEQNLVEAKKDAEQTKVIDETRKALDSGFSGFFSRVKEALNQLKEGNSWQNTLGALGILLGFKGLNRAVGGQKKEETVSSSESTGKEGGSDSSKGDDKRDGNASENGTDGDNDSGMKGTGDKTPEKEPSNTEIVSIKDYIKDIKTDLRYATENNSFGLKIYSDSEENLKLQYEAIKKLSEVQESLKQQGYQLKIWDAYRPTDAQQKLYDNYKGPAETKGSNVAKPGTSHHGTGKAVDLTLVDSNGNEVEMPTGFDDFSGKATWNSVNKLPKDDPKRKNAYILRDAMEKAGFYTIGSEWWHYQIDAPKSKAPRG